jgi:transposase InsO family protein
MDFHVTRRIIYRVTGRGNIGDFSVHKSTNNRFRNIKFGLKKILKAEKRARLILERKIQRYEKKYPGELVHFDTKSLRRARYDDRSQKSECLYVAIDDCSRQLFAEIYRGKNQIISAQFLEKIISLVPYKIEGVLSDNGTEFKGGDEHEFGLICYRNGIEQKYTRTKRPQTNGKAERVIRTIMEACDLDDQRRTSEERKEILRKFVLYYNMSRPHSALKEGKRCLTPCEIIKRFY